MSHLTRDTEVFWDESGKENEGKITNYRENIVTKPPGARIVLRPAKDTRIPSTHMTVQVSTLHSAVDFS